MSLDLPLILKHASDAWPDCKRTDLIWVGPLGSRDDALVLNRRNGEVTTGRRGDTSPCFKGSLEDFAAQLETDYEGRLSYAGGGRNAARLIRLREEYRLAVTFFRALPALERYA